MEGETTALTVPLHDTLCKVRGGWHLTSTWIGINLANAVGHPSWMD